VGAELDGRLCGFIAWREVGGGAVHEPDLELLALYVSPPAWGHGVGGILHRRYLDVLGAGSFRRGVLDVWLSNTRAKGFYLRRGWSPTPDRRPGPADVPYVTLERRRTTSDQAS
jgi:GNAT superfamily N-acetyltransferase